MLVFKLNLKSRIRSDADFQRIFTDRSGKTKRIKTPYFVLLVQKNDCNAPRIGVIASKKNIRKASSRNCYKRIVRECFRLRQHRLPSSDVVLVIYSSAESLDRKTWGSIVSQQLDKLGAF